MPIVIFEGVSPSIGSRVFIAPDAWLTGRVTIGDDSSVFFGAVLRGDIQPIMVGRGSNIQDHAIVHSSRGMSPVKIGDDATVGHRAIIHGATIGDRCIIGMGATVLDDAIIENDCIIGAHALITKGTRIPAGSLVVGAPAKVVRDLNDAERLELSKSAESYRETALKYLRAFDSAPH